MTVDNTDLLRALKKSDTSDVLNREIAEEMPDYVTRKIVKDEESKSNA